MEFVKKYIKVWQFIAGVLLLCILGIHLGLHFRDYNDLDLNDELNYLLASKHLLSCGTRILYPVWYKLISLFESNTINIYYLNQQLNIILLPICIYALLAVYFRNSILSLLFALLFLYSNSNVCTEYIVNDFIFCWGMKLNNFTLGVLCLLGCCIYFLHKRGFSAISLFTISFLILSYCRNEYCLLFIISAFIYGVYYLLKLRKDRRETFLFIFIMFSSLLLVKTIGLSITATEHSYLAYAQGYTRNYLQMHELPLFPNIDLYTHSDKIFGKAKSITDFFFTNPVEFTKNSIFNIYNMVIINSYRVSDILLPQVFFGYKDKSVINYLISWSIIIPLIIYAIKKLKLKNVLRNPLLLFLIISTIPTIMYCVLYVFEPRYFIFFAPLLYICIIHFLLRLKYRNQVKYAALLLISVIILYHPSTACYYKKNKCFIDQRIISSVKIIEDYRKNKKSTFLTILSNDGEFDKLIPNSSCMNISINDMLTHKKTYPNINFSNFDVIILTENSEYSSQSLIYNNVIKFVENNSELIHIVDYKKNVNLYLRK